MDCPTSLPTNDEICSLVEDARKMAIADDLSLGIDANEENSRINFACQVSYVTDCSIDLSEEDDLDDDIEPLDGDDIDIEEEATNVKITENDEIQMELQSDLHKLSSITCCLNLKEHSSQNVLLNERSSYTIVTFLQEFLKIQ